MGMPLSELAVRMSSAEFGLHLQLEVERQRRPEDDDPTYGWGDD